MLIHDVVPPFGEVMKPRNINSIPKSLADVMRYMPGVKRAQIQEYLAIFIAEQRIEVEKERDDLVQPAECRYMYKTWLDALELSSKIPEKLTMDFLNEKMGKMIDGQFTIHFFLRNCIDLGCFMSCLSLPDDIKITHLDEIEKWYQVNPKNMPICILEVGGGVSGDEYWQANRNDILIKAAVGLVDGILKNLKGQHIDETLVREMLLQTTTAKDKENIMDQVLQTEEVKDKIQLAQMPPPKKARMA